VLQNEICVTIRNCR